MKKGVVAEQNPGAGRVAGGTVVTISPSNGQGLTVPDVSGQPLDQAIAQLRQAGFGNVLAGSCSQDDDASPQGQATRTKPKAGTVTNRNTAITVDYAASNCGGGGPGNGGGDDD
jgi:beta-lactam-binding protein with PASTA domain